MDVWRVSGTSLNDLYALVASDNWEWGMPLGLAHWDGVRWQWVKRLEKAWIQRMILESGYLFLLDFNGAVLRADPRGAWQTYQAPRVPPYGYHTALATHPDEILIAGRGGALFRLYQSAWERIETDTTEHLWDLEGASARCLICGDNGTLLRFDGTACHRLNAGTTHHLTQIDQGPDGLTFVAGGISSRGHGSLIRIDPTNAYSCTLFKTPTRFYGLATVSDHEVYGATLDAGVLLWDGRDFAPSLPDGSSTLPPGNSVSHLAKINATVAGCGRGPVIVFGPPTWQQLPVVLDEAFVAG